MALKPARLQWSDTGVLRSLDYDDIYFLPEVGPAESHYVFLEKNNLPVRFAELAAGQFRIAELGFGSGLNFLLTAQLWKKIAPSSARLTYVSIEKHPIPKEDLRRIFSAWPDLAAESSVLLEQYPPLMEGFHHVHFLNDRIHLILLFGDIAEMLPSLKGLFDAWYLDGFAPAKNPEMWGGAIFPLIGARTVEGGTVATFSAAGAVRRGLTEAGFTVEKVRGYGVKRDMTVANKEPSTSPQIPRKQKKVTVLGAGLAGASAAFALAQRGYKVTVMDRGAAGGAETSGNPVGIVSAKPVLDDSSIGLFHRHGFNFTRGLLAALNIPSWNPCGIVHLDISAEMAARHQKFAAAGYPEEFWSYGMTEMGMGLSQALGGYISPPEFCRSLLNHPHITTRYSTSVTALEEIEDEVIVIALNNGSKSFRQTAWLPLQSLRGQMSWIKETQASQNLQHVFCHEGYITPAIDGVHYIGATFQREAAGNFDLRAEDQQENFDTLNSHLSSLGFKIEDMQGGRTGYRATTPDKLPVIGACPDYDVFVQSYQEGYKGQYRANFSFPRLDGRRDAEIYISAGFGAYGTTGAPLAGEMVASLIAGEPVPVPERLAAALAPERFIIRGLKRKQIG